MGCGLTPATRPFTFVPIGSHIRPWTGTMITASDALSLKEPLWHGLGDNWHSCQWLLIEHAGSGQLMVVSSETFSFFLKWILHSVQGCCGNTSPRVGPEVRTTDCIVPRGQRTPTWHWCGRSHCSCLS